jgi:hypothetical protein
LPRLKATLISVSIFFWVLIFVLIMKLGSE